MFKEIFTLLNSQDWYNTSPEIEILKGWYEKPKDLNDKINKLKRKYKFKK